LFRHFAYLHLDLFFEQLNGFSPSN